MFAVALGNPTRTSFEPMNVPKMDVSFRPLTQPDGYKQYVALIETEEELVIKDDESVGCEEEELYDDLDITYGDYGQLLNNYAYPTRNIGFIHDHVFQRYLQYGYHREAYACARKVIKGIENGVDVGPQLYFSFLFGQYLSGFYADHENARRIVDHIYDICQKDPLLMAQLDSNRSFYEEQFKYVM